MRCKSTKFQMWHFGVVIIEIWFEIKLLKLII